MGDRHPRPLRARTTSSQGKVTKLTNFGVFVELEPGLEGLLHISELADHKVDSPEEVVKVGDEIEVKILRVDRVDRKIGLSRKKAHWTKPGEEEGESTEGETSETSAPRKPRSSRADWAAAARSSPSAGLPRPRPRPKPRARPKPRSRLKPKPRPKPKPKPESKTLRNVSTTPTAAPSQAWGGGFSCASGLIPSHHRSSDSKFCNHFLTATPGDSIKTTPAGTGSAVASAS